MSIDFQKLTINMFGTTKITYVTRFAFNFFLKKYICISNSVYIDVMLEK
jgi:hypothetical protein